MHEKEADLALYPTLLDMREPCLVEFLHRGTTATDNKASLVMHLLFGGETSRQLLRNVGAHLCLLFSVSPLPHGEGEFIPHFRSAKGMMTYHERRRRCGWLFPEKCAHPLHILFSDAELGIHVAGEGEWPEFGKPVRSGLQLLCIRRILAVRGLNRDAREVHSFPACPLQLGQRGLVICEIEARIRRRRRSGNLIRYIRIRAEEARIET